MQQCRTKIKPYKKCVFVCLFFAKSDSEASSFENEIALDSILDCMENTQILRQTAMQLQNYVGNI